MLTKYKRCSEAAVANFKQRTAGSTVKSRKRNFKKAPARRSRGSSNMRNVAMEISKREAAQSR